MTMIPSVEVLKKERTLDLHSRIQVLDYPGCLPSKCVVCGTGPVDGRKFIDFGQQIEFYGAIYYCSVCMIEVAKSVGYIHTSTIELMEDKFRELEHYYKGDREELENYRNVFAGLRALGVPLPDISGPVDLLLLDASQSDDSTTPIDSAAMGEDSGSDESSGIEGPRDISEPATHNGKLTSL